MDAAEDPDQLSDEEWLARASQPPQPRHEADRVLMEFGYDPWQMEDFLKLSPSERLAWAEGWIQMANYARRSRVRT